MSVTTVTEYVVPVPGKFQGGTAYLDLETKKVPTDPLFVMRNGEFLRRRWSVFMAGVALDGQIHLIDGRGELGILHGITMVCDESSEVVYAATRKFDEMIVKGKFTNARRAHELQPFYPAALGAEWWEWRNLGPIPDVLRYLRERDLMGSEIAGSLESGNTSAIMVHLLRDVVTLILMDGNPDLLCESWIAQILSNGDFAINEIVGGGNRECTISAP